MLEDRSLGDAEHRGNVAHASGVITLFGEVTHSGVNDFGPFAFRTGPEWHATVTRWRDEAAADSTHMLTSGQETLPKISKNFNFIFRDDAVTYGAQVAILVTNGHPIL